jgi:hypothetical protein
LKPLYHIEKCTFLGVFCKQMGAIYGAQNRINAGKIESCLTHPQLPTIIPGAAYPQSYPQNPLSLSTYF